MRRVLGILPVAVLAVLGCDSGPATYPVSGSVSWNGKPIETGYIAFVAEDGQTSPATSKIVNGRYETRSTPGWKKVEIYADQDMGYSEAMHQNIRAPLVTADYNAQSKRRFEVKPEDNTHDLNLPIK